MRHLYRSVLVSTDVEVFILDSRNGYLGKDQARWLKDGIRKSSAAMKIIFSGRTFGLHLVDSSRVQEEVQEEKKEEEDDEDATNINVNNTITEEDEGGEDVKQIQKATSELAVTESENTEDNNKNDSNVDVLIIDPSESTGNTNIGAGKAPTVTTPAKKMSSSRQRALEATKEEFDEDGLSKSSLAHVLVSTHRKLFPLREKDDEDIEEDNENTNLPPPQSDRDSDSATSRPKLELSGGILIISSCDTEESFAATYKFGRSPEELAGEDPFCLEVGLGRARRGGGTSPQVCDEKSKLSPAESLVAKGRTVLYRSSSASPSRDFVNSTSCSIVVKANGVLSVTVKQVDTGEVVFDTDVSSALSNE